MDLVSFSVSIIPKECRFPKKGACSGFDSQIWNPGHLSKHERPAAQRSPCPVLKVGPGCCAKVEQIAAQHEKGVLSILPGGNVLVSSLVMALNETMEVPTNPRATPARTIHQTANKPDILGYNTNTHHEKPQRTPASHCTSLPSSPLLQGWSQGSVERTLALA